MNKTRIQQHLRDFDFRQLFIQELGWDNPPASATVTVDGQGYALTAIAHKRGMVAYHCPAPAGVRIPEYALRRKIEQQVTKSTHEHLIVHTDSAQTTQIWQWVKREPGKPAACREHHFHRQQSGEALVQKLQNIAFGLDEEDALTLVDVASRTRKGFDVERVTKRFYDQFKKEHASFLRFVEGIDDAADREWYASVMLNRLMFVYFVQRKGFLDGDPHYLRNRLKRCQQEKGKDKFYSFYRCFLLKLFHDGLGGKARPKELQELLGRIPYLNGGFFEKHVIEQRWERIEIPDKAFERIFDYFDQYQWHLDERPLRADNEINPDVLGFIFEKYINQKQMGAYYTQEDITGYMSRNTIIPFIFDSAENVMKKKGKLETAKAMFDLLARDPDRYIYAAVRHGVTLPLPPEIAAGVNPPGLHDPVREVKNPDEIPTIRLRRPWNKPAPSEYALPTEIWRELVARRQRYWELWSRLSGCQAKPEWAANPPNNQEWARHVHASPITDHVSDINDLVTLNLDIVQFAQDVIRNCDSPELLRAFWHALAGTSGSQGISILDPTVGSGAFLFAALNILKPLYEACLERMEAFVGDLDRSGEKHRPEKFSDFRAVLERVEAHPNSDYFILKSIILNNLFGVDIMEEATEICKLRLFLKLAAQVEPNAAKDNFGIEPLPDIDFNIRAGNTLVGYATADEVRRCLTGEKTTGHDQMRLGVLGEKDAYQQFEEKVQDADRAFALFRHMQTEQGMDSSQFASAKANLRQQMKVLEDELNGYLASDYGVKAKDKAAFSKWRNSHLPFHWLVEFYGIVSIGGFDIIIGNPPYVELNALDGYTIRGYKCEEAGNLYALVMERCAALGKEVGRQGLIVPVSSISTDRYAPLQELLLRREDHFSSFDDRPSRLFDGLEHIRLTIHILGRQVQAPRHYSTRYNKWSADERHILFQKLTFAPSEPAIVSGSVPKVCSSVEVSIVEKLRAQKRLLSSFYSRTGRHRIFYSRKVGYFLQVLDFEPRVLDGHGRRRPPSEFKELAFAAGEHAKLALCCLNANIFYWFITVFSDCRHVNKREVDSLPIDLGALSASQDQKELLPLAEALMADLKKNSLNRTMTFQHDTLTVQCIYPKASKPILDRIDQALARHYGFTKEELDFLLNYDIKYRLSLSTEGVDEE